MARSPKHPGMNHLVASTIGFTAGYLIGLFIEAELGWHAFLAAAVGNIIMYYVAHYVFGPSGR